MIPAYHPVHTNGPIFFGKRVYISDDPRVIYLYLHRDEDTRTRLV